jgi:hypothetical protein
MLHYLIALTSLTINRGRWNHRTSGEGELAKRETQLRQSHACYYITNIHKTRSIKDNQMNKRKMRKTMAVEAFYREKNEIYMQSGMNDFGARPVKVY